MAINCVTYPRLRVIYCNESGYQEFDDRWRHRNHEYFPGDERAWRYLERYNKDRGATSFIYKQGLVLKNTPWLVRAILRRKHRKLHCFNCPIYCGNDQTADHRFLSACVEYLAIVSDWSLIKRLRWLLK